MRTTSPVNLCFLGGGGEEHKANLFPIHYYQFDKCFEKSPTPNPLAPPSPTTSQSEEL